MEFKIKTWIAKDGHVVFGEGRRKLLVLVKETGSLNKAAKEMKMSYRAAWGKIKKAEQRLGYKLLESKAGGTSGGGSSLTPKGEALLDQFERFEKSVNVSAKKHFGKEFQEKQ